MKPRHPMLLWALLASAICCACGGAGAPSGGTTSGNGGSGGSGGSGSGGGSSATQGTWIWMAGPNVPNQKGIYGTLGVASAANVPGARSNSVSWADASGNFWLFGGSGFDSAGTQGMLNDLWKYGAGQWTWMGGSNICRQAGVYGTLGIASSGNVPGARDEAVGWTDPSGNFWLFGGYGYDSTGSDYMLNDLWEYSAGEWTWMGGSNLCCKPGVYGTQGTAAPGNLPGPRWSAASWTDVQGNFWLYGGLGFGGGVTSWGPMDDLWIYSHGEWIWIGGGGEPFTGVASYGTLGTASPSNYPGDRASMASWADTSGNLWLIGGIVDANAINDLWKYSGGQWTWMGGSNICCQAGVYGTPGVFAANNIPGARDSGVTWTDPSGNFWLFGGEGYDSTGIINYQNYSLNDLWEYSNGQWTWMNGSNECCHPGNYGQLGVAASTNVPGARASSVGWTDKSGNLWLFGGSYYVPTPLPGYTVYFNDLWEYVP